MSILKKKFFKTSSLELPGTTQNLVGDAFFRDCLNYEIVEDFFEQGNLEQVYQEKVIEYFNCFNSIFN